MIISSISMPFERYIPFRHHYIASKSERVAVYSMLYVTQFKLPSRSTPIREYMHMLNARVSKYT